jgi:hypothetical protein
MDMDIVTLAQLALAVFAALVGWPALLALIITALEYFGKVSPEGADKLNFWANAVVFVSIFVLALLGKIDLINVIDATLGRAAQLLAYLLILLGVPTAFAFTKNQHQGIRSASFLRSRIR